MSYGIIRFGAGRCPAREAEERPGRHLIEFLEERSAAKVDWEALADPAGYLGSADALISRVLAAVKEGRSG